MPCLLAGLLSGACALIPGHDLVPGVSRETEVRAAFGTPGYEWVDTSGVRGLAFPRGPMGTETYVARLDRQGALVGVEQVLDEDHFRRIRVGETTGEEVLRLIGPPSGRTAFPNKGQVAWDYRFQDTWGYQAYFSVLVDGRGVVAETVTTRIERRSDR